MKYISRFLENRPNNKKYKQVVVIVALVGASWLLLTVSPVTLRAQECQNILLVFGRGSSQNNDGQYLDLPFEDDFRELENESGAFFQEFEAGLQTHYPNVTYKAASVHNFPEKYNPMGYEAKGVFSFPTRNNMIQARYEWWPSGEYTNSILNGKDETVGYVKDELARCPEQLVVLGGYSQGAQMMGEALFEFTKEEREKISAVALFGDPKFIAGTEKGGIEFWKKSRAHTWKRGTASEYERGIGSPREPYVPGNMKLKTYSWCFADDFVCSGVSGLRFGSDIKQKNEAGHTRYVTRGIPEAVREIIQDISPQLYALDRANGGIDREAGPSQPEPLAPTNEPIDISFLVNTSGEVKNTLSKLRFHLDDVLEPSAKFFGSVRYGVVDFSELYQTGQYLPRLNVRQDLAPNHNGNLKKTMVQEMSWGGNGGGGVDHPDPHALAIEKTVQAQSWDKNATKHIVLFTDRPAKETQSYNICNNSVQVAMMVESPVPCNQDQAYEPVSTRFGSLYCQNVRLAIIRKKCQLKPSEVYHTNTLNRTLQDALALANSRDIAVTVVVHQAMTRPDVDNEAAEEQLRSIAAATGGLFLKYDSFSFAEYSDVMWRVHQHKPNKLKLVTHDPVKLFNDNRSVNTDAQTHVRAHRDVPTVLDVSSSATQQFDKYAWDFNGDGKWDKKTIAPTVEYAFKARHNRNVLTVAGLVNDQAVASITLPIHVVDYQGPATEPTIAPEFDISISAERQAEAVNIAWEVTDGHAPGVVFIGDQFGMPLVSAPYSEGQIQIHNDQITGVELTAWVLKDGIASDKQTIEIVPQQDG